MTPCLKRMLKLGLNAEANKLFRFRFSKPIDVYQPGSLKSTLGGSIGHSNNGSAPLQT